MAKLTSLLALTCLVCLAACGKAEDKPAGDDPGADTPTGDKPETAADKPAADLDAAKADPALMTELEKIASACEVNVSGVTVTKCPNQEARTFTSSFQKERDRGAAIDTWVVALTSDDEKVKTVAANLSRSALGTFYESEIDPAAARRLIAAVAKLEKYHAAQSVRAAVHAGAAVKAFDELYAMLDSHSYKPLRAIGYQAIMVKGRTAPLDKLKELAKGDDPKVAAAALEAPRRMADPTAEEKAAVCPWVAEYLTSDKREVYVQAGNTMTWCGGEYVDALLDEGEKRLAAGDFDRDTTMVFRDICFTPVGSKVAGTDAQCERNYAFLEKAVNDEKVDAKARGLALFAIYYQRRDAETMKLMKKYKGSKVPEIKKYAEDAIKTLRDTYKIK